MFDFSANSLSTSEIPLPGTVVSQYIRCGKPGCRCQAGEKHGPYFYRIWRVGDKVKKAYVPPEALQSVQAACLAYRQYQNDLFQLSHRRQELTKKIRSAFRQTTRLTKANQTGS